MEDERRAESSPPTIAVCIPSYKRPALLRDLLTSLEEQTFPLNGAMKWIVAVIDNDPEETARKVCEEFAQNHKFDLHYIVEKRVGLSHVRNAALDFAVGRADCICFIDDDEKPCPCWLDELVHIQRKTNADCVYGPVPSILPAGTPPWIVKGRFFDRPAFEDAAELSWNKAGTGNLLISCDFLRRSRLRFDHRFSHSGGEDSFFLLEATRKFGARIFGAAKAIAWEQIPPSRTALSWILRRRFRAGSTHSMCERLIGSPPAKLLLRGMKGVAHIGIGILTSPLGLLMGRHAVARSLGRLALGSGMCAGLLGFTYKEYALADTAPKPLSG